MRPAREESSREFMWKETDREKMLVEEAEKKLLATSSKNIDDAKKTKAQVEWARLESKGSASLNTAVQVLYSRVQQI
jgi:hypothetical protein